AILAHSLSAGGKKIRKAQVLSAGDIALLREACVSEVIAAVLDAGDVEENAAAEQMVAAMRFAGIDARPAATGRVNLHAVAAGIFTVDAALIDAINAINPAITVATLEQNAPVEDHQMVATVKIIPYAVPGDVLAKAIALSAERPIFDVHPFRAARVGVVQTTLAGLKDSVLDKTVRTTEARLARSGSTVGSERRVAHRAADVAAAAAELSRMHDLVVIFGASAVSDFDDVIPAAIRQAGGIVTRTGMPVDPGNLLVLGKLGGKPVIGAPGCARSPKENGFDWVLDRTLAGIEVTDRDIAGMGVGGLLMEIASRPQPRETPERQADPKVHAIVLAAGRSSRMGGPNKLLADFEGKPLVRRMAERVLASTADGLLVVTGHQADRVQHAVGDLGAQTVHNADFASGLASSLKAGVTHLPEDAVGALIVLGDMPGVTSADFDKLIAAFRKSGGRAIVRATHNGKRGNPVILPRGLFAAVAMLEGDTGARHLIEGGNAEVIDVELGASASIDVDTPEAMARAGGVLQG
ncbi:MAG: NTP transferase domain-containing protein, partial [Rhizobiaceae bacterium]